MILIGVLLMWFLIQLLKWWLLLLRPFKGVINFMLILGCIAWSIVLIAFALMQH